jgi:glycosyltransferase involved in cell wall biosynthesis
VTDLVVLSLEAWDRVWRRNQHLVAGLLRSDPGLRVLFVEPAADPLFELASRRRPRRGGGLRRVALEGAEGRLWAYQPTKWLPRRFDRRVDERAARSVIRAAARLGFTNPVMWVNDPSGATVRELTGWPALYDITDDWLEADRTPAEHARLVHDEDSLMVGCAEVVVCSPALARTKGAVRPVTLVPNAVDVAAYRVPRERPADLPDGPVALYLGTVHTDRIDLDLCMATAEAVRGRGRVVLVGPAPLASGDAARLVGAGVVLLGAKDRDDVPAYLQHADVLLVPHVVTPFTESLDPIKLYEYRAVGRPVVSTPVAGFRDAGDPRVTVAEAAGFADAVARALPATSRFPHGADDAVPTWSDRVAQMREVIDRVRRSATPR